MSLPYTRGEVKERAAAEWRGACNVTLPSFTPDMASLNEAGIAHDVAHAAQMGFWGTLVASECGTTLDEYLRFLEVAADAAPEGFAVVAHLSFDTLEDCLAAASAAEGVGAEAALLSYPPSFRPTSSAEIVEFTRSVAEQTDLALILFAVMTWGFKRLDPRGFPLDALEEMSKFDTAAAIKCEIGGGATTTAFHEVWQRCSEHVLVENPMEQYVPAVMANYPVRWIGTSAYESFGDRVPRWMDLIGRGQWDEAMELFWSYQPAREAKGGFHASFAGANLIHRVGWKYLGWLHGFNGGLLRMPQMRLNPAQMRSLRAGLEASGFDLPSDDEGFFTGRTGG